MKAGQVGEEIVFPERTEAWDKRDVRVVISQGAKARVVSVRTGVMVVKLGRRELFVWI